MYERTNAIATGLTRLDGDGRHSASAWHRQVPAAILMGDVLGGELVARLDAWSRAGWELVARSDTWSRGLMLGRELVARLDAWSRAVGEKVARFRSDAWSRAGREV